MTQYTVLSEPTTLAVRPGKKIHLRDPLNQADSVDISIDWGPWLTSSETVSSATWTADSGITVSGEAVSSPVTSATLTAGTIEDTRLVECAITTSGSQIRSVVIEVEVVNLR